MHRYRPLQSISRRTLLGGSIAAAGAAAIGFSPGARAASATKPSKLVILGDNAPWKGTILQDAIPAFKQETGIDVEYIMLPGDALVTRARTEMSSGEGTSFDIMQMGSWMVPWTNPFVEDVNTMLPNAAGKYAADFDMGDFSDAALGALTHNGKLCGIPYRGTVYILHYQKDLLEKAGFSSAPETFEEYLKAAVALTESGGPSRLGIGTVARQSGGMTDHFGPFLLSSGGGYYKAETREILINKPESIGALQYYGDLMAKHKVMPKEAITWEWDEIIANGQNDRYAMAVTLNATGTALNNSTASKTAGRWGWSTVPALAAGQKGISPSFIWSFAVPSAGKNKEWAFEFVQYITSKEWARRSMQKGNASARMSVLTDPEISGTYGWTSAAAAQLQSATPNPNDNNWGNLELDLRVAISSVLQGQGTAEEELAKVESVWQRKFARARQ